MKLSNLIIIVVLIIATLSINPAYSLIYPNGGNDGTTRYRGQTHIITWTPGLMCDSAGTVSIYLFNRDDFTTTNIASNIFDSLGYYNWAIPVGQDIGNSYRIKVVNTSDSARFDMSHTCFSIYGSQPKVSFHTNTNGNSSEIGIYPNPNNGQLKLDISGLQLKDIMKVYILSINGIEVFTIMNNISLIMNINASNLKSGIYFINVAKKDGSVLTKKFIISK